MNGQDPTLSVRVGKRIRAARLGKNFSQDDLGARIGLARSSIANVEAGRQDLPLSRLAAVAEVLNLDLAGLIAPGDLPAPPHHVVIRKVYEVECETCGQIVASEASFTDAQVARREHITGETQ